MEEKGQARGFSCRLERDSPAAGRSPRVGGSSRPIFPYRRVRPEQLTMEADCTGGLADNEISAYSERTATAVARSSMSSGWVYCQSPTMVAVSDAQIISQLKPKRRVFHEPGSDVCYHAPVQSAGRPQMPPAPILPITAFLLRILLSLTGALHQLFTDDPGIKVQQFIYFALYNVQRRQL